MNAQTDQTAACDQEQQRKQLAELIYRAEHGDSKAMPELRAWLDGCPEFWKKYGDLGNRAQQSWLDLLAGEDLLLQEAVRRNLETLRAEIGAAEQSPLEKLLVDQIVACFLQVQYAEITYAKAKGPEATKAVRQELMNRQESASRRYLAAIKQLAFVRKLLKPALSPVQLALGGVSEDRIGPGQRVAGSGIRPAERTRIEKKGRIASCSTGDSVLN